MRKLGVLLVASILLFVFGVGTFVYEFSQISPHQMDLQMDDYEMSKDFQTLFKTFRTKSYDEYYAKNNEIHISIRYGKALKDKITLVDDYY